MYLPACPTEGRRASDNSNVVVPQPRQVRGRIVVGLALASYFLSHGELRGQPTSIRISNVGGKSCRYQQSDSGSKRRIKDMELCKKR
jgi:hypothetical protein